MDRTTRKELKTDHFAETVGHTLEEIAAHRRQVTRYAIIGAVVIVLIVAAVGFFRYRAIERAEAFRAVLRLMEAPVAPAGQVAGKSFATDAEQKQAVEAALKELIASYEGSNEAAMAHYFLASHAIESGKLDKALTEIDAAIAAADRDTSVLARFTRANILRALGKSEDAERIYRELLDSTRGYITRDQVVLSLADTIKKSKPDEALKLLEPLRAADSSSQGPAAKLISEIQRNNSSTKN